MKQWGLPFWEERGGRMGKQEAGGLCRGCWPECLSPPTGSSQGGASPARASQECSPLQTACKTWSHGARGSQLLWHCVECSFCSLGSQGDKTLGWGGYNLKARGTKEVSRLQLHPGLALDSVTSFLINHLVALKETSCNICSKNVIWKIYHLKIITTTVSGHLSLSDTVPNSFHACVSHPALSHPVKEGTTVDTVWQMRSNRARIHTQTLTTKSVLFITRLHGLVPSLPTSWHCWG